MEADQDTPRSRGDTSVDSSSSAYFKRRFDGKKTRREALEQRFGKGKSPRNYLSPSSSSTLTQDVLSGPQIPDTLSMDETTINSSAKMLAPRTTKIALDATDSSLGMRNKSLFMDDFDDGPEPSNDSVEHTTSQPQHLSTKKYYRVIYRGVISLLSDPELSSPRSGVYLSYGEIVESSQEIVAAKSPNTDTPATPTRKQESNITESLESEIEVVGKCRMIRVDRVLTGGYTVDAVDAPIVASDKTPKRGNIIPNSFIAVPSTMPVVAGVDDGIQLPMGYLLAENRKKPILERLESPPKCESGSFLYKVVSSTPLRIYTGPSFDAPTTKGMLVPGTSHEISLRVTEGSVSYLRLTRRQGWVLDRNLQRNGRISDVIVMKDVTVQETTWDCNTSVMSMVASSIATPLPPASGRHRAPRRQRVHTKKKDTIESSAVPRHVSGPVAQSLPQSRTASYDFDVPGLPTHDRAIMSPPSNISLLSDDSSLENSSSQRATEILTPDRSVARSGVSSGQDLPELPSFFLMRVNAPRGLKILDAPHFQVNNLIHGKNTGGLIAPSPSKDSSIKSSSQSIFQTMSGGHHTTTLTSKAGNPAIFDSNTKSRKLPRGSVFEASKRMEASSAFNQGAGLIKLSDNSGWAIVPKREELDEQYRNVSGALAGIKEGEASRAFDEVGNAIVGDHQSPVYIRIHTRTGLSVSLPPNPALDDDVTSPSSSAGGTSSVISAGNASSLVRGQDSDVASSVGSSFLDSMFRTPRRKGRDSDESEKNRRELGNPPKAPTAPDKTPFSNNLPCGAYVEVDRWAKAQDGDSCVTEYARLRGGQGWIPRSLNGKPITEIISPPEVRFGSYWFRVQDTDGIKVRLGPSRRAPSIKSEDGVYFRFECGEYLRASEIVTFFRQNVPSESYAKLYRNRHIRLYAGHGEIRPLSSLTVQAEWVQVSSQDESYLEECTVEPRIERHRQGWRYNVVLEARIQVRKGPSFESEVNGVVLLGGESILINERVTGPHDPITWLRLKDGQGWVHNVDEDGETLMIPHSIRHRNGPLGRPTKPGRPEQEDIAYNAIIARLFHSSGDLQRNDGPSTVPQSRHRKRWT